MELKINTEKLYKSFFGFLNKQIGKIILLLVVLVAAYCIYIWYSSIYHSSWSNGRKQSYIKSKERTNVFHKKQFENIISQQKSRKDEFKKDISGVQDIFRIKNE
ncbi:MAG TPA: hypothetical protein ENL05_00375 [Candidatus Moranbacteria bacterium]|nr:hypothetical protein [Candidatus Moranbacteria bacterium]